jgi:hypothetical protein
VLTEVYAQLEVEANVQEEAVPSGTKADPRLKRMVLSQSLPYKTETLDEMDARLEHIAGRLVDTIEAGDWDQPFQYWSARLME